MAETYRIKVVFNQSVMGVGETYLTRTLDPPDLAVLVSEFLRRRALCLWTRHQFVGIQLGIYGRRRASVFLPAGVQEIPGTKLTVTIPATGSLTGEARATRPDQLRAALQFRINFGFEQHALRYLAGIADGVSSTEPDTIDWGGNVTWRDNVFAFLNTLVEGSFQTRAIIPAPGIPEIPATGLVLQEAAPGNVGVVTRDTPAPGITEGMLVHLRGFRRKTRGGVSLNGRFYVDSINNTLLPGRLVFYLRGTAGFDVSQIKTLGTIQRVAYGLSPITSVQPVRIGIHKRGRPSPAPRGRRLARLVLDP